MYIKQLRRPSEPSDPPAWSSDSARVDSATAAAAALLSGRAESHDRFDIADDTHRPVDGRRASSRLPAAQASQQSTSRRQSHQRGAGQTGLPRLSRARILPGAVVHGDLARARGLSTPDIHLHTSCLQFVTEYEYAMPLGTLLLRRVPRSPGCLASHQLQT